jgi:hypothetical protein
MSVTIQFAGPQIADEQLQAFEQERQIILPSDYRQFLLRTNGGVPTPNAFPFKWGEYDAYAHVGRFLGLNYPAALYSFEWNQRVQERISPQFFIIAKDYTDSLFNLVCISLVGDEFGAIYYLPQYPQYDAEANPHPNEEDEYPFSLFIADNFTQFLERLTEPPAGLFDT